MSDQARTVGLRHRVEGRAKLTGRAAHAEGPCAVALGSPFASTVPVTSTVALGRIRGIETAAALAVPGVRL